MRGTPLTIFQALLFNAFTLVVFTGVAAMMVRRARNPNTVPRDELERIALSHLKAPSKREKLYFIALLVVAVSAPWLTRYFAR